MLPDLSARLPVDVRSSRLPRVVRELPPRVVIDLEPLGTGMSAMAKLVYASPPASASTTARWCIWVGPVPVRDTAAERRMLESLRSALDLLPGRRMHFEGPDSAAFVGKLKRWRGDLAGTGASRIGADVRLEPRLRVSSTPTPDGLGADVSSRPHFRHRRRRREGTTRTVDAASVIRAWQDGLGILALEGGGWAPLPAGWLKEHGARVADLLAAREVDGRIATHAVPELGDSSVARWTSRHRRWRSRSRLCSRAWRAGDAGHDRGGRPPRGYVAGRFGRDLAPLPARGASAWGSCAGPLGAVLADDMGLGKTLQTLCAVRGRTLVVCPRSVVHNWAAEIRRFRPGAARPPSITAPSAPSIRTADVTLTTYALLRLDAETLAAEAWDTVVLDEAQAIKNPDSQVARAAYRSARRLSRRAQRHAGREPPRRALEPAASCQLPVKICSFASFLSCSVLKTDH